MATTRSDSDVPGLASPADPEVTETAAQMLSLLYAGLLTQVLATAAELGIADLLSNGPRTVAELATGSGTHAPSLHRALRALAGAGVFVETAPRTFALTPLGERLRTDADGSMRHMARLVGRPETHRTLASLDHSLRTGEPAFDREYRTDWWSYLNAHPAHAEVFYGAMGDVSRQVHAATVRTLDLGGANQIVDVGGGHGHLMAALLCAHPNLTGVVFDRPEVVAQATGTLRKQGVADRATAVGGDFFEAVPGGADVYILSWILHDWPDDQAVAVLSNVRRAMPEGGRVLIVDTVIPEGNAPHLGRLLDIVMLAQHGGRERTELEFAALLEKAGLTHIDTREIAPWPTGLIVGGTPRG